MRELAARVRRRRLLRAFLVVAVLAAAVAALGAGDVYAFDGSAASLQGQIAGYEAAGAPASAFAAGEQSVAGWRRPLVPDVPASVLSGALVRDPLLRQRGQAKAAWVAWHSRHVATLLEAALARASGGLQNGEPADIMALSASLDSTVAAAQAARLDLQPGATAQDEVAGYWLLPRSDQLTYHDSLKAAVGQMLSALQSRVAAKKQARALLGQARNLLGEAQWLGTATAADQQAADAAAAEVNAARSDADLARVMPDLQKLITLLAQAANAEPAQPPLPTACVPGAPAQLIEIHLVTQVLVAYKNGCPFFATWVTTGMPDLRTERGTFHIFYKARWFLMQSPWPYWSPYWYPNTWVGYAMEFIKDGTFIHTADWEPPGAFGPGSENGPYASHGCVHVQDGPAATLFAWASIGSEVIVGD